MNQFMYLLTLVLFNYIPLSSSSNPSYGTCPAAKCGRVKITYPFYLVKEQKSYCGYPGFEVTCPDAKIPHINISGDSYVIQKIWYTDQSFQVINSAIAALMEGNCRGSIKNMTLEDTVFKFSSDHKDTILLLNCPDKNLGNYKPDLLRLKCGAVVMYENDPRLKDFPRNCSKVIGSVPYEGKRNDNITEVLSSGVLLNWTANNCSACNDSGGQCGFYRNTSEFKCFCPDRDHAYRCGQQPLSTTDGFKGVGISS